MLEMKMSDKFNGIYELIEVDNKDAIVQEIKALKNFTEEELSSIFGSPNILWILENYSVKELKDKVKSVEDNIVINVGNVIKFKLAEDNVTGVILEVTGIQNNRCTALCYYKDRGYYKIIEGISSFDIEILKEDSNVSFTEVLKLLGTGSKTNSLSEEGDL